MRKTEYAEQHLRKTVQLAVSELGARLFRVNTGQAWAGDAQVVGTSVFIKNAYPIRMGLIEGGSDTIGWIPVTITREMVGRRIAVFTAVELKTGHLTTTTEQERFLSAVLAAGGAAAVARSVEDATNLVRAWLAGTPPGRVEHTTRPRAARRS